jgi:hypothetical protein
MLNISLRILNYFLHLDKTYSPSASDEHAYSNEYNMNNTLTPSRFLTIKQREKNEKEREKTIDFSFSFFSPTHYNYLKYNENHMN